MQLTMKMLLVYPQFDPQWLCMAADVFVIEKFKMWLLPPDASLDHNNARRKHLQDTGQWLMNNNKYLAWRQQPNSFMWVNGTCEHPLNN